jgi:hypothetical protein
MTAAPTASCARSLAPPRPGWSVRQFKQAARGRKVLRAGLSARRPGPGLDDGMRTEGTRLPRVCRARFAMASPDRDRHKSGERNTARPAGTQVARATAMLGAAQSGRDPIVIR